MDRKVFADVRMHDRTHTAGGLTQFTVCCHANGIIHCGFVFSSEESSHLPAETGVINDVVTCNVESGELAAACRRMDSIIFGSPVSCAIDDLRFPLAFSRWLHQPT